MGLGEGIALSPLFLMAVVAGIFASMFYLVIIWTHITKHYNFYKWVALALRFVPAILLLGEL